MLKEIYLTDEGMARYTDEVTGAWESDDDGNPIMETREQVSFGPYPPPSEERRSEVDALLAEKGLTVPPDLPAPAKTEAEVRAAAERELLKLAAPYSPSERETWPRQVEDAKAVKADPAADVPLLASLASARNLTVDEMADVVLAKNTLFSAAAGAILAKQAELIAMDPIPDDFDSQWPTLPG